MNHKGEIHEVMNKYVKSTTFVGWNSRQGIKDPYASREICQ